jgi:predicted MFS family arabinose efflux permease
MQTPNPWIAVFSVALSASVFCAAEFLPVGLLRFISQALGVSEGMAGLTVTAPAILGAFSAPFITVAIGSHDRRRVLLALSALLVASNVLGMVAPNFGTLIVGRILFGIGLGGFWAIGAGIGGRLVSERSVGRATSIIFAGVSVGMLVGGAAGALIGELVGWRVAFGAALALSVLAFVAQFAYLPRLHVEQRIKASDLMGILATANGRVGFVAMLFVVGGQFATYTYITPFLAQVSGFDGKVISSLLLGYNVIGLLGTFIGGAAGARNVKVTVAATMTFLALPILILPAAGHIPVAVIALLAVWGTAYGAIPVALQMWMVKAAPNAGEAAMALLVANFQVSIAVGSFIGGLVVDHQGLNAVMYFGAFAATIGLAIFLFFAYAPRNAGVEAARA